MIDWLGPEDRRQVERFARALDLQDGFEFHMVISDSRPTLEAVMREVLPSLDLSRQELAPDDDPRSSASRWLERLGEAMHTERSGPFVLDAWSLDPDQEAHWGWAFARLNERRDGIMRALGRPLILLLSVEGERVLGRMAPDLWAIRSTGMRLRQHIPRASPSVPLEPARAVRAAPSVRIPRPGGRHRALLVGSPGGLHGVPVDVERMRAQLDRWEFTSTTVMGVTRSELMRALALMLTETRPDDAVVVYYSGLAARGLEIDSSGMLAGPAWNYLVTADHDLEGSARGIADFELDQIAYDLAKITPNVTFIFDCCFARRMTRTSSEVVKTLGRAMFERTSLPDAWHARGAQSHDSRAVAERNVIRVAATSVDGAAFEFEGADGSAGYFTTELCAALDDARTAPISWDTIIRRVRERIFERRGSTTQRPEIAGPRNRLPFSLDVAPEHAQ